MFTTLYQELMQSWVDPHARHALLVHAPVVFAGLGVLPVLGILLTGFKSPALKLFSIVWFLLASGGAYLAQEAGEAAEEAIEHQQPALSPVEKAAFERHEDLGTNGWIWPLIPAGLVVLTLANSKKVAVPFGVLALVASLGVGGWVALTGHAGGRLVYVYGVGVPARGAAPSGLEAAPAPSTEAPAPPAEPPAKPEEEKGKEGGGGGG